MMECCKDYCDQWEICTGIDSRCMESCEIDPPSIVLLEDDDPDRCPYGGICFMPGCDCYNDCPRYPHGGDDW